MHWQNTIKNGIVSFSVILTVTRIMTRTLLTLLLLALLTSCSSKVELNQTPLNTINRQLSLGWLASDTSPTTGYYTTDSDNVPDGPFSFTAQNNKGKESNELFALTINGSFDSGRKSGKWIYDYEYDDGSQLYEKYLITLFFDEGECIKSCFSGVIGKAMPITNDCFSEKHLCNPLQLREKIFLQTSRQ